MRTDPRTLIAAISDFVAPGGAGRAAASHTPHRRPEEVG